MQLALHVAPSLIAEAAVNAARSARGTIDAVVGCSSLRTWCHRLYQTLLIGYSSLGVWCRRLRTRAARWMQLAQHVVIGCILDAARSARDAIVNAYGMHRAQHMMPS